MDVEPELHTVREGQRECVAALGALRTSSFTRSKGKVVFDAPVGEFHSFAAANIGVGFHIWHGAQRHRFVFHKWRVPAATGPGALEEVAGEVDNLRHGLADLAVGRSEVDRRRDELMPRIAPAPPQGVKVRPPLSKRDYLLATFGFAVAGAAVVGGGVVLVVLATG